MSIHACDGDGSEYDGAAEDRSKRRCLAEQDKCKKNAVNRFETCGHACQLCFDMNKAFDEEDMGNCRTEYPEEGQVKKIHRLDGKLFKKKKWHQHQGCSPVLITGNQCGWIGADVLSIEYG